MPQPSSLPSPRLLDRLRSRARGRTLAFGLAFAIEALLLILLLTLGADRRPATKEKGIVVVDLDAPDPPAAPEKAPEPAKAEDDSPPEPPDENTPTPPQPAPPQPSQPQAVPRPPPRVPIPLARPAPPAPSPAPARPAPAKTYGPPDKGGSPAFRDTERVGTAPNGEPLYAAAWYRKPEDEMLRGYLSGASGPGWGLIACRTAPDYRVEDCVGLGEYPQGSRMMRSVLAAAWEFRVRPPRRGGRVLVGAWVQIRIDYVRKRP